MLGDCHNGRVDGARLESQRIIGSNCEQRDLGCS